MASLMRWQVVLLALFLLACGGGIRGKPTLQMTEQELFQAGKGSMERGDNNAGRGYLRRYEVRYPRGTDIEEAKFLIAESYYRRGMNDEKLEGVALFRSFLTFYPRHPLACEAQLRIVQYHHKRMRSPERDQSETHQAVEEARRLLATYPDCPRADDARQLLQDALDRLALSEFKVGEFYLKTGRSYAASQRFVELLEQYADYGMRDKVYYYLYQAYQRLGKVVEAEELRQQLAAEKPDSNYLGKMD